MHVLKMDCKILRRHRLWTGRIYPQVIGNLARGTAYTVVTTGRNPHQHCYPASVSWVSGYFNVIAQFFGARKNLTCARPSVLNKCVQATDVYLRSIGHKQSSRDPELTAVHAYCKALFSYAEMCQGHILAVDPNNPLVLRWQMPTPADNPVDALQFVKSLHVKVCPYCNQGTLNLKKKFPRTEIDHYFPRAYYPCLGISLYNLVPACTECNQKLKGRTIPDYATMYSPYDKPDYHDAVMICDCVRHSGMSIYPSEVSLKASPRKGANASRHLAFQAVVDYLGRYEAAYRQRAAEYYNLYPLTKTSYRKESIRKVAKRDKAFARKYFSLLYSPQEINRHPFAKLAIDIVHARERQLL